ncbi:MAG: hypothetical protein KME32_13875 [Mojavia pulchra JT2-VF2]|jgi:hypothetical protein|uniref:Uncharacterized protein n=1 Tax=Mojavia pulchra JT2-VF2 TaxID=287848 RepID=A0A951PXU4_9NOST|nr:hypothetical protein [Mojavia pulchra JT2-VF2]
MSNHRILESPHFSHPPPFLIFVSPRPTIPSSPVKNLNSSGIYATLWVQINHTYITPLPIETEATDSQ